ncbi:Carbohydrate diacid regulator [bioreactor metagenome]|uniref:Carbohydrate diacid regulator n=1 Tax=bioreactor metagenome TaxID=1076179 RepID=A0A644ZUL8_9ZZZZ
MSNRVFQGIVHQMKEAIDRTIGVVDETGAIISCSELGKIGEIIPDISTVFISNGTIVYDGKTFVVFGSPMNMEYAVFVEGDDDMAQKYVSLVRIALENLQQCFDERYDRANFIKNVILDNILPGDIYLKSRELRFNTEVPRVALLIRLVGNEDSTVFEMIQNIFPDKTRDFVISINEHDIVLIKEVRPNVDAKDLEKLARSIIDSLGTEYYSHALVGIGSTVVGIKDLARSFKEAQVAIEVGKFFDIEKTIISYDNLGIARLIYQLPTTLCQMFLNEVFRRGSVESLDQETLFTIQKFFENNLNVSETSRKLFVHRNTLVYRLEKIKKITGLDLREFDDAIVFKVALMVRKYLDANPVKY